MTRPLHPAALAMVMGARPRHAAVAGYPGMPLARVGINEFPEMNGGGWNYPPSFYQYPSGGPPGLVPPGMVPAPMPTPGGCSPSDPWAARARLAQARAQAPTIPLSLNSAVGSDVAAGATVTFTTSPTVPVCPIRLIIPRVASPFFTINSIVIGRMEWNAEGDGAQADVFAPDSACCPLLQFQPLQPGQEVSITVTNRDAAAKAFFSTLLVIPGVAGGNFVPDYGGGGCV